MRRRRRQRRFNRDALGFNGAFEAVDVFGGGDAEDAGEGASRRLLIYGVLNVYEVRGYASAVPGVVPIAVGVWVNLV